jgi:hypothetical protein
MRAVALIVVAGCGHLGFAIGGDGGSSGDDAGFTATAVTYVKASNTEARDQFGFLAISRDGNTLAIGAPLESGPGNTPLNSGAVYVFVRSGSTWMQQAYLRAANADAGDSFGVRVALSDNGNTLAVSAEQEDSASRFS